MKKILLTAVVLLALMSCKDDALVCETVVHEFKDYHINGLYEDAVGFYDIVRIEDEDCY